MRPPLVLVYHSLGDVPRRLDPSNLVVDPGRFRHQMELLRRRGYSFVKVSEFVGEMDGGPPSSAVCAVTFDDGGADNAHALSDLVEELEVPMTLYVCAGLLGRPHPFVHPDAGLRLMTAEELRIVTQHPLFEIGAHTNTHADLSDAGAEEAYREMSESKAALEKLTGTEVLTFAYPACAYSAHCPGAARRAGFLGAVTCGHRGGWRPYELRREAVGRLDRSLSYELKVRGLYEPLFESAPGRLSRWVTRPVRRLGR